MTPYSREDLTEGWEFKFLRSGLGAFGKPERLREVLAEEARAGWALVEKFDDGRLRLKRPAGAKERDAALDFDPYRSSIPGEGKRVLRVLGVIAMISIVTAALVWFLLQSLR